MSRLMDLVAGDAPEILLVIGTDDLAALDDSRRFVAHLALGSGLDPTWLDLFAEAARTVTNSGDPADFIDARLELEGIDPDDGHTIERVDPAWIGRSRACGTTTSDISPAAGSTSSRTTWASSRARRSPGSASWPGGW